MKTNWSTYVGMSLKVQVNQKKPRKMGEHTGNKKNQNFYQERKRFKGRRNHCRKYGYKKTNCWELHGKPNTESKQEERDLGAKVKGKFDISKLKL